VLVEDDCDKICDGGWKERPYAWNPVGRVFIEGERKRKGIGYRIVKIYRYEETLERINLGYNLRIHYRELLPNSVFSQGILPEILDAHQGLNTTSIWTPTTSIPNALSTTTPDGERAHRIEVERQPQEENEVVFSRLNLVEEEENWE
jgi:hypothetical protein